MHRDLLCKEDNLNSDNIGSALLNLSDVVEDMEGLKLMLEPFNDVNEHEFIPHIVRSLESFINDINDVHNYLDRLCINSVKRSNVEAAKEIAAMNFAAALCDSCDKAWTTKDQAELDSYCKDCVLTSRMSQVEGRC